MGALSLPLLELGLSALQVGLRYRLGFVLVGIAAMVFAGSQGHFELNVYNPVMAYNFLQSVRLMADAAKSFTENCVVGIEPRLDNIRAGVERSLMLVTALAPKIGYDNAAKIAKSAHKNGTTLREEALKTGLVTAEEFERLVRPEDMVGQA